MNKKDTIVAIITALGRSSVGIIRVSGSLCILVSKKILKKIPKIQKAEYMFFYDLKNQIIDKGIVLFFSKPNSFTGEDVLELHGHGNPIVLDYLINNICKIKGIRLAKEGEFTERAFLNKKIDLIKAESISDLIDANSIQTANLAINSLEGNLSNKINNLIKIILIIRTDIEANIDFFITEDINIFFNKIKNKLIYISKEIKDLISFSKKSYIFYEGAKFVICGEPNVGKSSIFNILAGDKVAIVTNVPGTTRDVLHKIININGINVDIIDTAGLHHSNDEVEIIGIEYAINNIKNSNHLLFVIDSINNNFINNIFLKLKKFNIEIDLNNKSLLTFIINKADINNEKIEIKEINGYTVITVSAKLNLGIDLLYKRIKQIISCYLNKNENIYLINKRKNDLLIKINKHILNALNNYLDISTIELLAEELKYSQKYLYEITGEFYSDELLKNIFSKFCIGK